MRINKLNEGIKKSVNQYAEQHNEKSKPRNSIEDKICKCLIQSTEKFKPKPLFDKIYNFVKSENELNRILFSEIYSYIYLLNDDQNSTFINNLDRLLDYSNGLNDKAYNDVRKVIVKLYDHIHATLIQDEQATRVFDNKIKEISGILATLVDKVENVKKDYNSLKTNIDNVSNDLKSSEKNYITILGIFASFVVTFVGGLSFSSSVLNGISSISVYRLFIVILLLGFILLSICFSLYWFIARIVNSADIKNLKFLYLFVTSVIIILLIICLCCWCNGFVELRNKRVASIPISSYSEIVNYR